MNRNTYPAEEVGKYRNGVYMAHESFPYRIAFEERKRELLEQRKKGEAAKKPEPTESEKEKEN